MQGFKGKSESEVIVKLSSDLSLAFRGVATPAAPQLEELVQVMTRHQAPMAPQTPMGGAFPTTEEQERAWDNGFYTVYAASDQEADEIIAELKTIKGVEAAYKKPPSSCPSGPN